MHTFYAPDIKGNVHQLPEDESKHAIRVLRLQVGDLVNLIDGKGGRFAAEVADAHPKRCRVTITKSEQIERSNPLLHLAVAPTKNIARFEWLLEKATEIGVAEITPLQCAHSERTAVKSDRLHKVLVAAAKQSQQAWVPVLNETMACTKFLQKTLDGERFIAHCDDTGERTALKQAYTPGKNAVVLIGPEGDFSPEEVAAALAAKYRAVTLGQNRLRTETAGLVACHTFNVLNE